MAGSFPKVALPFNARPKLFTPTGKAIWPKISAPDFGSGQYPKPQGEYSVTLRLTNAEAEPVIAQIEAFRVLASEAQKEATKGALKLYDGRPYAPAEDRAKGGVRTPVPGFTDFKFKRTASGKRADGSIWRQTVKVIDSVGQPLTEAVFSGSRVKVAYQPKPWITGALGFGIGLELQAVRVMELVSSSGEVVISDYEGFMDAEEGFTTSGATQAASTDAPSAAGENNDGPGDADDF
jgi:hypothetical protein